LTSKPNEQNVNKSQQKTWRKRNPNREQFFNSSLYYGAPGTWYSYLDYFLH